MTDKTILVVGTYDTKDDELDFLAGVIRDQNGQVLTMDVSVLGDPSKPTDYSKHDVAKAGESSIEAAIASGDENHAMQIMANGASMLAARLFTEGAFDGVIILGGSMGTDLALDVCSALPLGVPKYIVSTISFSPLIPAERGRGWPVRQHHLHRHEPGGGRPQLLHPALRRWPNRRDLRSVTHHGSRRWRRWCRVHRGAHGQR